MTSSRNLLLTSDSLKGTPVRDKHDEVLGNIKDLMIDVQTGEVIYAVLSVEDGFLNMGSKYFAVPLQAFSIDTINERMVLDVSKESFEKAPGFDKDNWPRIPQDDFIKSVYVFYNVERYHQTF